MERKKDEQMIYLKDLLFAALYRWKTVLAVALALAVVLGGMQGISGLSAAKGGVDEAYMEAVELYEQEKAVIEQEVETIQQSIDNQQVYLDGSVLMQLDPRDFYEASMNVYVKTEYQIMPGMSYQNPDRTDTVLVAYESVLEGGTCAQTIAEAMDIDAQYVYELLTVEMFTVSDCVQVSVKAPTADAAEAALTALEQQVEGAYESVTGAVCAHTVSVLNKTVNAKTDLTLADTQEKETDRMAELMTALDAAQEKLAALVQPTAKLTSISAVLKNVVIFAVLGAILGAFLTVCVIWVMHICTDKVYSARTLINRTGVKTIGCVPNGSAKGIDLWLRKLEGRQVGDEQDRLAMAAVDISCRAQGAKRLLVTGSADAEALVSALRRQMPGVQVDAGCILESPAALEALKNCDAVVLAEACGSSRYSVIDRQAQIICDYEKQLLGCILIGG